MAQIKINIPENNIFNRLALQGIQRLAGHIEGKKTKKAEADEARFNAEVEKRVEERARQQRLEQEVQKRLTK